MDVQNEKTWLGRYCQGMMQPKLVGTVDPYAADGCMRVWLNSYDAQGLCYFYQYQRWPHATNPWCEKPGAVVTC